MGKDINVILNKYKDYSYNDIFDSEAATEGFQQDLQGYSQEEQDEILRAVVGKSALDRAALRVAEGTSVIPEGKGAPVLSTKDQYYTEAEMKDSISRRPGVADILAKQYGLTDVDPFSQYNKSVAMFPGGASEQEQDIFNDPKYKALLAKFGTKGIAAPTLQDKAAAFEAYATSMNNAADAMTSFLSKLANPLAGMTEADKEARFKPQTSRKALDQLKERGPMQRDMPELKTSTTGILANVIVSALGGAMKQFGLNEKGDRQQALASTEVPPELTTMLQSSQMIRADIEKYDQKVAQIEDLNFELAAKHQYQVDAMEADFERRADAAQNVYMQNLENFLRYSEARHDKYKIIQNHYRDMAKNLLFKAGESKVDTANKNKMLKMEADKTNAMIALQNKRFAYSAIAADRARRKQNIVYDQKALIANTHKVVGSGKVPYSMVNDVMNATTNAGIALASVRNHSDPLKQAAENNSTNHLKMFEDNYKSNQIGAENYFANLTAFSSTGMYIPANAKYYKLLSSHRFSAIRRVSEVALQNGRKIPMSEFGVVLGGTEDGKSLIPELTNDGYLVRVTPDVAKRNEAAFEHEGAYYMQPADLTDLARLSLAKFVPKAVNVFASAAEGVAVSQGEAVNKATTAMSKLGE